MDKGQREAMKKRLLLFSLLLFSCAFVASLDSTRLEQTKPNEVKVTTLAAGLLTIASTKVITAIRGTDVSPCSLEKTFKGEAHGVICRDITRGFVLSVETLGTIAARVTQTPSSSKFITFELDKTARELEENQ
jgi:hypothetical protein